MGDYKDYCSFFIPRKALFGGFPNQEQTKELMNMGVKFFVDLTFPMEVLAKYKLKENCSYLNFPIVDRKVPISVPNFSAFMTLLHDTVDNLKEREKIYIHCKGGHGRSGLVVAVLLRMLNPEITIEKALSITNDCHNQRRIMREKWRNIGAPQTFQQKRYVHKFFSDLVYFRAYATGSTTGFSNYSYHSVTAGDEEELLPAGNFKTSEALFQASKDSRNQSYVLKLISAPNPKVAKKLGAKIIPSSTWFTNRYKIMYRIIELKLEQNPLFLFNLIKTGQRNIIFNSRKDDFFGTGERGDGQNIMGRILMKIRRKEQRKRSGIFETL